MRRRAFLGWLAGAAAAVLVGVPAEAKPKKPHPTKPPTSTSGVYSATYRAVY